MLKNKSLTRWLFIFISISIISLILWNTYLFFKELKENERAKMEIWAAAQKEVQNSGTEGFNMEMVSQVLQANQTTPMVLHSVKEDTYVGRNIDESILSNDAQLKKLLAQFTSEYQPMQITYNGELLQVVYFGNSELINKLKYYPAVLILIIFLFFLAIYLFYKTSKSAEQNRLWAGMAKETAHQIGTPLSSLVGWTEILKSENVNPEYIVEITKDIDRLETITDRFSKIGSVPTLKKMDFVAETQAAFDYLKSRTSKLIAFSINMPNEPVWVELNPPLFGWTIENLVKNGIDAMKGKGKITITIKTNSKYALLHVTDTGKGVGKGNSKKVFNPGYTTKRRGWGLGLSLAKRIVEEYHFGKIRVLKSTSEGTTMEIALKLKE